MKIGVGSYWQLEETVREFRPHAVISIVDQSRLVPKLNIGPQDHFGIGFHDIEQPEQGKTEPSREHIEKLIEFAAGRSRAGAKRFLIHCGAGVRRSPAAAFIVSILVRQDDPVRAAHVLFEAAPFADPNMLMIKHADTLGGYSGEAIRAVEAARGSKPQAKQQHFFCI